MSKNVPVLADGEDPRPPTLRRAFGCVADGREIKILAVVYETTLAGYLGNTAERVPPTAIATSMSSRRSADAQHFAGPGTQAA